MRITDWPENERPRERLLKHGAAALSEAELLAIFLRTGVAGKSAVDLGRDLIARFRKPAPVVRGHAGRSRRDRGPGPG
jgi:DNA repair protein RadC